jgi:hypothetical protein
MCSKRASLLSFVPATQFTLLSGEESLTDYQFNKKIIHHLFCSICGIGSFGRGIGPNGVEMVALIISNMHTSLGLIILIVTLDGTMDLVLTMQSILTMQQLRS